MVCWEIEGHVLKEGWQFLRKKVILIVLDEWSGGKTVGGKEKEDKIIKGCYVDLPLIDAFILKSSWQQS